MTQAQRERVRDVLAVGRMAASVDQLVDWITAACRGDDYQDDRLHYVVLQRIDGRLHGWGPYITKDAAVKAMQRLPELIDGPVAGVLVVKPVPRGRR